MVYRMLKSWLLRRHPNKSKSWIIKKYYIRRDLSKWNFHAMIKEKKGNKIPFYLYQACKTPVARHIKIKGEANPFNPKFKDYFKLRDKTNNTRLTSSNSRSGLNTRLLGDNVALLRA
jgi:RNA-directed DNA polymerase